MHILKYKTNNIYFEPRLKNRTSAFPSYRRSNSNYLADQTPFILLKNLVDLPNKLVLKKKKRIVDV